MDLNDLNAGQALEDTIEKITAIQAKNAASGSKGHVVVHSASNVEIVGSAAIIAAIGQTPYNTLAANFLTALNTSLSSAKTTAQTALDAL